MGYKKGIKDYYFRAFDKVKDKLVGTEEYFILLDAVAKADNYEYLVELTKRDFENEDWKMICLEANLTQSLDFKNEFGIDIYNLKTILKEGLYNMKTDRNEWVCLEYSNGKFAFKTTHYQYTDDNKSIIDISKYGTDWVHWQKNYKLLKEVEENE